MPIRLDVPRPQLPRRRAHQGEAEGQRQQVRAGHQRERQRQGGRLRGGARRPLPAGRGRRVEELGAVRHEGSVGDPPVQRAPRGAGIGHLEQHAMRRPVEARRAVPAEQEPGHRPRAEGGLRRVEDDREVRAACPECHQREHRAVEAGEQVPGGEVVLGVGNGPRGRRAHREAARPRPGSPLVDGQVPDRGAVPTRALTQERRSIEPHSVRAHRQPPAAAEGDGRVSPGDQAHGDADRCHDRDRRQRIALDDRRDAPVDRDAHGDRPEHHPQEGQQRGERPPAPWARQRDRDLVRGARAHPSMVGSRRGRREPSRRPGPGRSGPLAAMLRATASKETRHDQ